MNDILAGVLMLLGSAFCFLAAFGLHKMPDFYCRMQATTKGTTLGVGLVMLAVGVHAGGGAVATKALAVVVFLFITAPVGAHMISRAAYMGRIPQWSGTLSDALEGVYDEFLEPSDPAESDDRAETGPKQPEKLPEEPRKDT